MFKVARLAAAMGIAACAAQAADNALDAVRPPACRASSAADPGCALRLDDAGGDGAIAPGELSALSAASAPVADWAASQGAHGAGLDFKEAALDPQSAPPPQGIPSRKLIPALLALGALVLLLRKRPL